MQEYSRTTLAEKLKQVEILSDEILSINDLPWIVKSAEKMKTSARILRDAIEAPCATAISGLLLATQKESSPVSVGA